MSARLNQRIEKLEVATRQTPGAEKALESALSQRALNALSVPDLVLLRDAIELHELGRGDEITPEMQAAHERYEAAYAAAAVEVAKPVSGADTDTSRHSGAITRVKA